MLALLGVLIAPFFIDWTAYRADFEREASRILGQRVSVKGAASARLLPFPSVSFADVEVEGGPGGEPLFRARRFEMDAELAPYLSGEIRIFSVRVEDPVLALAVGPDGRMPALPKGGALPTSAVVVLEEIAVSNGTIRLEDAAAGRTRALTDINGSFAARSLVGPASGSGTLRADGRPLSFQLSTGAPVVSGRLPVRVTVDDPALLVSLTVDGTATLENGEPRLEGALRAVRAELSPTQDGGATRTPVSPLPPFTLAGQFAGTFGAVEANDVRLSVGAEPKPYVLTGKGSLLGGTQPRFALDLQGEQVDIDDLAQGKGARRDSTLKNRLEAARRVLAEVPKPDLPGTIRLALPVVVAGDTTFRDLSVEASPSGPDWFVRRFGAELPGRTRLEASGTLGLADEPTFKGQLLLAARQPSGLSEWLTGGVDPAIRTLPGAGFSADVDLSGERQRFDRLEVDIGGDRLTGSLERSRSPAGSLIAADLDGGRMDLDALVAFSRIFTGRADSLGEARRGTLKLAAGPVAVEGTTVDRVDMDLGYNGSALDIVRADLKGLAASDVSAKGHLQTDGADPSGRIEFTLASRNPSELIGFLSQRLPGSIALDALQRQGATLGPLALGGTVATVPGEGSERPTLNLSVKGTAAKTAVSVSMMLGNGIYAGGEAGRFGGELALSNNDPAELLGQLGVETLPLPVPSPLALTVSLSAGPTGPVAASAALRAPGSELTTEGSLALTSAGPTNGEFTIALRSDDLAPWLIASGNAYGSAGLDPLPVVASGALGFDATEARLGDIEASVGRVDLTGDLAKPWGQPLNGSMFFSELSVPWLATLVYGQPAADPARSAAWNGANFGRALLPDASFAIDLASDRLMLGEGAEIGEASARVEAKANEVRVSDLRGTFAGGYGTGSLLFRNADGVGGFSASADLQGLDLGSIAISGLSGPQDNEDDAETPDRPPVFGTADLTLKLEGSGQSYAGVLSALTGAGSVHVENAGFAGIRAGLFPVVLKHADAEGFEATPSAVARLVDDAARGASYPVANASTDFSIAGGVVRFAPVRSALPGETLTAEASLTLANETLNGRLRLALDPGDDAVAGTEPAVDYALGGTLEAPLLSASAQPLTDYLSARALEREQARVEAVQSALQEKLRLRREARLYRFRQAERDAADEAAGTAERLRIERLTREERARVEEERREAAARAAETERRAEAAERDRRARAERQRAAPTVDGGTLDLDTLPDFGEPSSPPDGSGEPNLPGVRDPFRTPSAPGISPF